MKFIWEKAEILRSTCNRDDGPKMHTDRTTFRIGDSVATFIPIGAHGDKIRGLRANCIISDEFGSLDINVYEKVIVGFGAVSKDPVMNSVIHAVRQRMIDKEEWSDDLEKRFGTQEINQQIISGTAGYGFEHFYKYWKRYHDIITGERDNIMSEEDEIEISESSRKNYSITRINYSMIPKGFMDDETIARAKASMIKSNYDMEYEAVFALDSEGFFKRSLIQACTVSDSNPIIIGDKKISFIPRMYGDANRRYVYGIDPASEHDNLAIVILEVHENHSRIVHCWTVNKKKHRAKVAAGLASENDYFRYCVQKVRELMTQFPCARIMMDSQGGGYTLLEIFGNPDDEDDQPIYEVIDPDKEKDTDHLAGLHLIELCNNNSRAWLSETNHGMKFDMESKTLLFPEFDLVELAIASEVDADYIKKNESKIDDEKISIYDTLEDVFWEIEELKNELVSIEYTKTGAGTERWDTPNTAVKGATQKKDRYSALVIANRGARDLDKNVGLHFKRGSEKRYGHMVGQSISYDKSEEMSVGPAWWKPRGMRSSV